MKLRYWCNGDVFYIDLYKDNTRLAFDCYENRKTTPFEQYIGVKDQSGHNLYEGDIVEFEVDSGVCIGSIKFNHQKAGYQIDYQMPPFRANYYRDFNVTYGDGVNYIDSTIKLIGNIHTPTKGK